MPPSVQSKLAQDHFIMALFSTELHAHTELAYPRDLQEVLEKALERNGSVSNFTVHGYCQFCSYSYGGVICVIVACVGKTDKMICRQTLPTATQPVAFGW